MSDDIRNDEALVGDDRPQAVKACMEQLGRDVALLKRLARPPTGEDDAPGDAAALPSRLALLADALDQVLRQAARRAQRTAEPAADLDEDEDEEAAQDAAAPISSALDPDAAAYGFDDEPLVFGVTMDQWDALDRLMQTLQAHGDVVSASNMADFAQGTLPMVGHAIFDGALAVREILEQVEAQPLTQPVPLHSGVGEPRAVYAARITAAAFDGPAALEGLRRRPQAHLALPGRMDLH